MKDKLFKNALERGENPCPPIWMMRQAGRYQSSYMAMKQDWSFEQMCKLPRLASDVAMLPIDEFDFDVAILFSDILFHLEGLGLPLKFNPGPKFEWNLDEDNWVDYKDVEKALKFLDFQSKALETPLKHFSQACERNMNGTLHLYLNMREGCSVRPTN